LVAFQRKKSEPIGVKAPLPGFVEPALASSIDRVPSGSRWIHEIKFDGYRVQIHLANEAVRIFTRRGHDWTHRFKKVHDAWHIKAASAVDGEIVVPAADGTTDFSVLQNEFKGQSTKIVSDRLRPAVPERSRSLEAAVHQRKAQLKKIIAGTDIQFSESFAIDGRAMFEHACRLVLEGVVSKVRDSLYPTGPQQRLAGEPGIPTEGKPQGQARPNVLFEAGMAMAREAPCAAMPVALILSSAKASVWKSELWRDADDKPSREEAVKRLVKMLKDLIAKADNAGFKLAPFIGIACPGVIKGNGSIEKGAQNLPGNWESSKFNLPARLVEAIRRSESTTRPSSCTTTALYKGCLRCLSCRT
jgi:hypothetical protein